MTLKNECCEKCSQKSLLTGFYSCSYSACPCHTTEKKCSECQFDQPDTYGHSLACSKRISTTDTSDIDKDIEALYNVKKFIVTKIGDENPTVTRYGEISDWRERFDKRWDFHGEFQNTPSMPEIKAFIEKELADTRLFSWRQGWEAGQQAVTIGSPSWRAGMDEGRAAERDSIIALAEEIKNHLPSGYAEGKMKAVKSFVTTLISKIINDK